MKNLRIGLSRYGLLIIVLQLFPNLIWALFPPDPNRLAGNVSSVLLIEYGEHILGVTTTILLIFLVNKTQTRLIPRGRFMVMSFAALALYWLCWGLYFSGYQANVVIYPMVILPPVAFFCAGMAEKVYPIAAISLPFLIFHLSVALENYPLF